MNIALKLKNWRTKKWVLKVHFKIQFLIDVKVQMTDLKMLFLKKWVERGVDQGVAKKDKQKFSGTQHSFAIVEFWNTFIFLLTVLYGWNG